MKYILDFDNSKKLDKELKTIIYEDFNYYINNRLIFTKKEDMISPIISNKEIVGYFYKYNNSIKEHSEIPKYIKI